MSQEGPAIEVSHLGKRYGATLAVDDVSFTAARAQVTALLGPNGAGKTTTVEICEGYRQPDRGTVRVLGEVPGGRSLRPRVGVMLQDGVGYPGARVREMLTLLASFARHPHDVDALLQTVGLTGVAKSSLRKISGGEKQRLALAMALVGRPELVILDEPTAGLDVAARRMTWELVESLRSDGVSVLITTHNMEEAERLADHVVIVDRGRVVAQGSPAALTTGGDGQLHFRADPGLALADVLGSRTWVEESPGHYVVAGPVDPAVVAAVTAWCAQRGVLVSDLRTGARTLEDVFLAVTGRTLP